MASKIENEEDQSKGEIFSEIRLKNKEGLKLLVRLWQYSL